MKLSTLCIVNSSHGTIFKPYTNFFSQTSYFGNTFLGISRMFSHENNKCFDDALWKGSSRRKYFGFFFSFKSCCCLGKNYNFFLFLSCFLHSKDPLANNDSDHQNHKGCVDIGSAQCCCIWVHCLYGECFTPTTRGHRGRTSL